jgi:hypothetical protein
VIVEEIIKHDVAYVDSEVYKTELHELKPGVEKWRRDNKIKNDRNNVQKLAAGRKHQARFFGCQKFI